MNMSRILDIVICQKRTCKVTTSLFWRTIIKNRASNTRIISVFAFIVIPRGIFSPARDWAGFFITIFFAKVYQNGSTNHSHSCENCGMPPMPTKLRHIAKIHPVETSYEAQRDEYGGNNGQYFHHLVHLVAHAVECTPTVEQIRLEWSDWVQLVFVYPPAVPQTHWMGDNPVTSGLVSHYRHLWWNGKFSSVHLAWFCTRPWAPKTVPPVNLVFPRQNRPCCLKGKEETW